MLQTFWKSNCLAKEFFLVNSFIGVFLGILRQVSEQLPRETSLIFGIFSIILSICCCHLVVCYLTKPLWNCLSANQIFCSWFCSLSLPLSAWLNMYRTFICRFHMTKFLGAVWKFSLIRWSYILELHEVLHIIYSL